MTPNHIQTDTNRLHFPRVKHTAAEELVTPIYLDEKDVIRIFFCFRQRKDADQLFLIISLKTSIFQQQYYHIQLSKTIVKKIRFSPLAAQVNAMNLSLIHL